MDFWSRVDKSGNCWLWTGALLKTGYGSVRLGGKTQRAHRVAWELLNGPIPPGMYVLHDVECRNRHCVRHLRLGTHDDNMKDMVLAGMNRGPRLPARGDHNGSRLHPERLARGERHGSHTRPDRWARGERHGSKRRPDCVVHGEQHPSAKLTAADVERIRSLLVEGESISGIARQFGVARRSIRAIRDGETWKQPIEDAAALPFRTRRMEA